MSQNSWLVFDVLNLKALEIDPTVPCCINCTNEQEQ
jgi:hypothetical protein